MKQAVDGAPIATVRVGGHTINVVRQIGEIDLDHLERETQDAGGHAVFYGTLAASALAESKRQVLAADIAEAEVDRDLRISAARADTKTTEAQIKAQCTLSDKVKTARLAVIDAEERANMMRAISMAVDQKQRTITALAYSTNRERDAKTSDLRSEAARHADDFRAGSRHR